MKEALRTTDGDETDQELEDLKQELIALYPDRAKAIECQKDFGVLAYFRCCAGKGPTSQLMDSFRLAGSVVVVDENEVDDDDPLDLNYSSSSCDDREPVVSKRTLEPRSGVHQLNLPPDQVSSQESIASMEEPLWSVLDGMHQSATMLQKMLCLRRAAQYTDDAPAFTRKVAVTTREYLDMLTDMLSLEGEIEGIVISDNEVYEIEP
ncbi:hypothetical protein BC939DRAFT_482053 [Gamsiella multidivaricata]|uniref:uncharacterized protein n=1 Tax=Gamsiella multidivaricata TaxID=101098 RepID=UPI00221E3CF5|nr:uncharacterized protein BC939DRAFT_482053 [Gamsiella multidivaricata]KAI7816397.1 hypothetical protein BC939DRAFT_482053 [Gamsiella multidivaricata]